jgi:hypothetical protein
MARLLTLVTYRAKPGCEEELAGLLRTHVARLRELALVSDWPSFVGEVDGSPGNFVESFWWLHDGAPQMADDHSEVQEMWMRVEDLCVPGGIVRQVLKPLE